MKNCLLVAMLVTLTLPLSAAELDPRIVGRWVGAESGNATKSGRIVEGGIRVTFVQQERGSRTPWNVAFIAPKPGHMTSETISGGCGFYPSGKAFCRGYGIPAEGKALETTVSVEAVSEGRIRFSVEGLVAPVELVR